MTVSPYDKSVFINCPFDKDYQPLFNAITFTVTSCGFVLRCAKEYQDSSSIRINNIIELIGQCKYSIHDLSRVDIKSIKDLPRFNMPLELGICIGAKKFGSSEDQQKEYLILEKDPHRFKQFLSDLSGQDIREHQNDVGEAIKKVRNWLAAKDTNVSTPGAAHISKNYKAFSKGLPKLCKQAKWTPADLMFTEFSSLVANWLIDNS